MRSTKEGATRLLVYTTAAIIALACGHALRAETTQDCMQFARTVEIIDTMAPDKRAQFETELAKMDKRDRNVIFTLRALNHLKMGGTKRQAWQQCDSF